MSGSMQQNSIQKQNKAFGTHALFQRHSLMQRKDNGIFLLMCAPALLAILIFNYLPMFGIVIAFQDYNYRDGLFGSPFVGFEHFKFFFQSQDAWRITRNTIGMNALFIGVGLIFSVGVALLMYEVKKRVFVKTYQTFLMLPNFISWVIVGYMVYSLLDPAHGLVNNVIVALGGEGVAWYSEAKFWPFILTAASVWKKTGIDCIIYYAALLGIDSSYYEAAELDGANRFQILRYISIPFLTPTIIILTILAIGNIFRADFGLFYQLTRNSGELYATTDVIDTYVYRALRSLGDMSMSAAVGLFQSLVGFVLILGTNLAVKKYDPDYSLF